MTIPAELSWLTSAAMLVASLTTASTLRRATETMPHGTGHAASQPSPQSVADELLAADHAYSAASARTDLVAGISGMFASNVIVPVPGGRFARSVHEARQALLAVPTNARARAEWTPVRVGVSADGLHGFSFGFMTVHNADGSTVPVKYMAYWVKDGGVWKVAAYKRARAEQPGAPTLMAPSLPSRLVAPAQDATVLSSHYRSVVAAEQAFSDEAQHIGLGAAFQKYGRADAVNMGPPTDPGFVVGSDAIGRTVSGPSTPLTEPSPVYWSADTALVASSGDLAITFGVIRQHKPADASAPGFPFFTIWRRDSPTAPWRYIAE